MSELIAQVREVLITFAFKLARLHKEQGEGFVATDDDRQRLLAEACLEAGLSEAHLAEALTTVPELAEWYARALEHASRAD